MRDTQDHLHPVAAWQQQRRRTRRAEGLGDRAQGGYFSPQQKLIAKVRDGAKVTKKHDVATTQYRRVEAHESVKIQIAETYTSINPAAVQRQIQALTTELLALVTSKAGAALKPADQAPAPRASTSESTTHSLRILT